MSTDYVGSVVKVRLTNGSTVQGRVTKITPAALTLTDLPGNQKCNVLDLSSHEIKDVDIVYLPTKNNREQKPITIMKRDQSPNRRSSPQSPIQIDPIPLPEPNSRKQYKKGDAFAVSISKMSTDFDFQSSNKLFKKEAIFDEWRQQDGVLPKQNQQNNMEPKLKPTEMVIESSAPTPGHTFEGDFVTDDKVPVVGLALSRRIALFKRAISGGLSYSHVVSVAGMSISQMVIQVLGGSCRVNLGNHNKPPVVAVLVSSGDSGKVALTAALHLSQHGLNVKVVIMATPKGCDGLINILTKSKCVVSGGLQGLPNVIDIILEGTQDRNTMLNWPDWLNAVVEWTDQCTAPILAIDPQHPTQMPQTPTSPKWTCALGAPLLAQGTAGRLFLVDIGLFSLAFKEENIPYRSPFFDKFIIPIHRTVK